MPSSEAMRILAIAALTPLTLEAASWALFRLASRLFSRTFPDRRKFLADQSQMIQRWLSEPARRETIHPLLGWAYRANYESDANHINSQGLRARHEYTA